ncbi:MAG: polysaccharide deacetylase family protein [Bdellovibrionota bacterium]
MLCRSAKPSWRILTYHRVTEVQSLRFPIQPGMYVLPETFAMHMRYLADYCNVIPLSELLAALKAKTDLPPATVVVTFDDGWLDNFEYAFPILREYSLPATIFLATAYIGTQDYFWTDRVSQAITALNRSREYRERVIPLLSDKLASRPKILSIIGEALAADHITLESVDSLVEAMKELPQKERKKTVDELSTIAKEFTMLKSERLFVNWDEVRQMALHQISFGSHTHNHHPMTELTTAQLSDEIVNSLQALRSNNITPVSAFCYPGGYYNRDTQRALKEKGIEFAMSVEYGSRFDESPALLGRINFHEDICSTLPLFTSRVWGLEVFRRQQGPYL